MRILNFKRYLRYASYLLKSLRQLIATLFLFLFIASPVQARDGLATYTPLPIGYRSIKVFDNKGEFAGRILPEKRYWVSIDRIPAFLQKAVVAVEDARFYEHGGIDVRGIARALVKDVVKGRLAEGGSTITQQLIKNRYLSSEKTIGRKYEEARMAMEYEQKYTKKQILEMYFNEIYYGNGAWGIAQASRLYFDKSPEELNDAECALLAGVQKNPGRYNPLGKSAQVTGRRDVVLARMVTLNMITPAQKEIIRNQRVTFTQPGQAPHYVTHIRSKLIESFGPDVIEQGGLEVTAAMDLTLQKSAELALEEGVKKRSPGLQGALVCLDPVTGDVLAAVGGVDGIRNSYNRAFWAKRQPGSTIKPLVYAAALEKGITAASVWDDSPVSYPSGNSESWKPQNYGREVFGELNLSQALAHSNNIIAVKLLDAIGIPYFVDFAIKMGLTVRAENGLTLALGTDEVSLSDLVVAYAPLANGGMRPEARTILKIYDHKRNSWIENPSTSTPVLSPAAAYIATQMLKGVLTYGTAKSLKKFSMAHPSAGKTGTTDDYRDAWFVGYTPEIITGVWVGYDKPRPGGKGFTGGAVAAPIWEKFMRKAVATRSTADFQRPDSVISVTIDSETGYLATPDCPKRADELYISGTEPTGYCPKHGINKDIKELDTQGDSALDNGKK